MTVGWHKIVVHNYLPIVGLTPSIQLQCPAGKRKLMDHQTWP